MVFQGERSEPTYFTQNYKIHFSIVDEAAGLFSTTQFLLHRVCAWVFAHDCIYKFLSQKKGFMMIIQKIPLNSC